MSSKPSQCYCEIRTIHALPHCSSINVYLYPCVLSVQGVSPAASVSTPSTAPSPAQSALAISNAQALMKQVAAAGQQATGQQQQQTGQIVGKTGDVSGMVASLAAKRNIPIQLSLSISPASSLAGSSHGKNKNSYHCRAFLHVWICTLFKRLFFRVALFCNL